MGAIWRALVAEPRAAVEAQWGAIADELLREVGGRLWRNREAACLGLADLLQARSPSCESVQLCPPASVPAAGPAVTSHARFKSTGVASTAAVIAESNLLGLADLLQERLVLLLPSQPLIPLSPCMPVFQSAGVASTAAAPAESHLRHNQIICAFF